MDRHDKIEWIIAIIAGGGFAVAITKVLIFGFFGAIGGMIAKVCWDFTLAKLKKKYPEFFKKYLPKH